MSRYWKALEKRVAKAIGGERTSAPYRDAPDAASEWLVVECKARQQLPQWIVDAVENARRHTRSGQLGIAVLHEKNRHQKNDLVVLKWADFQEWFGGSVPEPELPE